MSDFKETHIGTTGADHACAYWATVELYRTFLFEDGPLLETIADAGGQLNARTLSLIARSYSVARTIPKPPDNEPSYNLDLFTRQIIALAKDWPNDTIERAEACRKTAEELAGQFKPNEEKRSTREGVPQKQRKVVAPYSAVTKLVWFLKPDGWTVYDRFASDAVLRGSDANGGERLKRFYGAIAEPLVLYADRLRDPLKKLDHRLHPERLIDKYLVLRGMGEPNYNSARTKNLHFLKLLPPDLSQTVERVALSIESLIPHSAFPEHVRPRKKKGSL